MPMLQLRLSALCAVLFVLPAWSAQDTAPQVTPVAGVQNLVRVEGVDAQTGTNYVRLVLSSGAPGSDGKAPPRFSMECTERNGKRDLNWLISFGAVDSVQFFPTDRRTPANPFPPPLPKELLTMTFEGYTRWKPMTRSWDVLPSGELRYRNPGMHSPNLDTPRSLLLYVNSLPGLRIGYAKPRGDTPPEEFFATRPLLDELKRIPLCQP